MALRILWAVGFCLVTKLAVGSQLSEAQTAEIKFTKTKVELVYKKNKKTLNVELAVTQDQHARGLMYRKRLKKNEGMLFIFIDEQTRNFWMKNTLINLDIAYFNKNKILIDIQQMTAVTSELQVSLPTYPSKQPAMYALEMQAGWFKNNNFPEATTLNILSRP